MLDLEKEYYSEKIKLIAGVDEAGRGPLAGPVVACAVVLPNGYFNNQIDDSKKLSKKKRETLFKVIQDESLAIGIGIIDVETIEKVNIYEATKLAMKKALENIDIKFDLVLTDAMKLDEVNAPLIPIIKGDAKAQNIAAASIIAKVTRDKIMEKIDLDYPQYGFKNHKGYGTKKHIEAIKEFGLLKNIHRPSFCKNFIK